MKRPLARAVATGWGGEAPVSQVWTNATLDRLTARLDELGLLPLLEYAAERRNPTRAGDEPDVEFVWLPGTTWMHPVSSSQTSSAIQAAIQVPGCTFR